MMLCDTHFNMVNNIMGKVGGHGISGTFLFGRDRIW
jgi:hypothetical protein